MLTRHTLGRLAYALIAAAALACIAPASATEPADEPVILVAKPALLPDRLYGATILIAMPVGNDQHIGFIVNKPTPLTLGSLFPDHEPSQKVTEPVYLGGPVNTRTISALVRHGDSLGRSAMQITPDLYLVMGREAVDRIIEGGADHARFFAGLVVWAPSELRTEIERGFWFMHKADSSLVLRKSTEGMWEELLRQLELKAMFI